MATVTITEEFSGDRTIIKHIVITGADDSSEQVVAEAAEFTPSPNGRSYGYWKLMEAVWNMNDGYDTVKLYYEDETNDLQILNMQGDGSYDARGWGGVSAEEVADEGNTPVDEDYEIKLDATENGDENAASTADITCVFKFKDHPFGTTLA